MIQGQKLNPPQLSVAEHSFSTKSQTETKLVTTPYRDTLDIIRRYWRAYGGWMSLLQSAFFRVSLVLTLLMWGTWTVQHWWNQILSVLPNLLGFSLGGLAVFLSFGSDKFRELIAGKDPAEPEELSPYMSVAAAFSHFIIVQILALLFAILAAAFYAVPIPTWFQKFESEAEVIRLVFWLFGYWLFVYALLLGFATVLSLFRIADWYDRLRTKERAEG